MDGLAKRFWFLPQRKKLTMYRLILAFLLVICCVSIARAEGILDRLSAVESVQSSRSADARIINITASGEHVGKYRSCKPGGSVAANLRTVDQGILCGLVTPVFTLQRTSMVSVTLQGHASISPGESGHGFAIFITAQSGPHEVGRYRTFMEDWPSIWIGGASKAKTWRPFSTTQSIILEPGAHRILAEGRLAWASAEEVDSVIELNSAMMQTVVLPLD